MLHASMMNIMGTGLDVLMIHRNKELTLSVWDGIQAEVQRLHRMFNRFDAASELSAINRQASRQAVHLSNEWWEILCDLRQYHQRTEGYFDASLSDFRHVLLDTCHHAVTFAKKDIALDLGAYAKGYALNKIKQILMKHDVRQALVNFGNSAVLALGAHPHGEAWNIGVNHPLKPDITLKTYSLRDCALSTSGNTAMHSAHIVNPHTGVFYQGQRLASVVSTSCVDAEVLSTALIVADSNAIQRMKQDFELISADTFN
jgi:thiamine biosynthesis lipoprotein